MTGEQVQKIVEYKRYPGQKLPVQLIETHISWVILTPEFVYKIKKPVQFSFLDFSTLEKRAFYCREEVHLNRRLAPEMYLDVLPIGFADDGIPEIGANSTSTIDMAVWMKRMDDSRQMDILMQQNAVTPVHIKALAAVLARFHQTVVIPAEEAPYQAGDNRADFDDLFKLTKECVQLMGDTALPTLKKWREKVGQFLEKHEPRLHTRARSGFWVEGHGDLHCRNIFLLPDGPIVFDCIEFNPHFRTLDVLNDLAFLCMDLDAGGHQELASVFMENYTQQWSCIEIPEDEQLLLYFKAYRANVRLKVTLMAWQQNPTDALKKSAMLYWRLIDGYLSI